MAENFVSSAGDPNDPGRANLCNAYVGYDTLAKAAEQTGPSEVNLENAVLNGADLTGAKLSGAILTGATIKQAQLDTACGTDTILPLGLTIEPCPPPTPEPSGALVVE